MFCFSSCQKSPEHVARDFSNYISHGDISKAKELSTPSTQDWLSMSQALNNADQFDMKYEAQVDSSVVRGEFANVWVKDRHNPKSRSKKISLIKKDGKWLVSMDKSSL